MPRAPKRPCLQPACPELVEVGQDGRCDKHGKANQRFSRLRRDPKQGARYRTARWGRLRKMVGSRDNWICRMCGETRPERSMHCDHIVPVEEGGDDAMDNLQTLCAPCHSKKTLRERGGMVGDRPCITLVCGPPGCGKTTFVAEHKLWGDLIVDLDAIASALSGLPSHEKPRGLMPFVWEARDAVLGKLARHPVRAWIIATMPKLVERQRMAQRMGAQVIVLDVGVEECLRRIVERGGKADVWRPLVAGWWEKYEREPRKTMEERHASAG